MPGLVAMVGVTGIVWFRGGSVREKSVWEIVLDWFFFSSRRRHTRYWRDWSSDVCSSDLHEHEALRAHAAHGDVGVVGEPQLGVTVKLHIWQGEEALDQPVAQPRLVRDPLGELLAREAGGGPEARDARYVLGPAPQAALLPAPEEDGGDRGALAHVERADALRPVELVARDGERRYPRLPYLDVVPPGRLDRVGVERHAPPSARGGQLLHRLHGADLVVGPHHRRERRVRPQRCRELVDVHEAVPVHPEPGHLEALRLQPARGLAHGGVLDSRDDEVAPLGAGRPGD